MPNQTSLPPVFIVDGVRTPFLKTGMRPGPFTAADLATAAGQALLQRLDIPTDSIDEVILGCVMPRETEANIARIVGLRLGLPVSVPAWTVQRNCASGMQALDAARRSIQVGSAHVVLAGGVEAMSHAPLLLSNELLHWLADFRQANVIDKIATLRRWHWRYLQPIVALRCGLSDAIVNLSMGQTAEILAERFAITRDAMDHFALNSHQRALQAKQEDQLAEIITIYDRNGKFYQEDTGIREDSSLEKLAKLKPFFEKFGLVTAGNSSQITDGAACLLLASEQAVQKYRLPILGQLLDCQWAGVEPEVMGIGPVMAVAKLLLRQQLSIQDIDYFEINEAFAAQVLACQAAWQSDVFCREHLELSAPAGILPENKLNIDGGAIALGHPVGASGARIVLHLLHILKRHHAKRGIASLCIGGGQGGAMLVGAA